MVGHVEHVLVGRVEVAVTHEDRIALGIGHRLAEVRPERQAAGLVEEVSHGKEEVAVLQTEVLDTLPDHLAIELQVAHVRTRIALAIFLAVNVVHGACVGEVTVPRERAGDLPLADLIDQFDRQFGVIDELLLIRLALLLLLEPPKVQRIVLACRADVVGKQVVVRDFVPLFDMVPEVPHIFDRLAVVVDQHVVDGDHAALGESRRSIFLMPIDPRFIQRLRVPGRLGQEAVEARLVGRLRELPIDARHRFAFSDDQATHVFGEMPTLAIVLKEAPKLLHALLNDRRPLHDPWHRLTLRGSRAPPVAISLAAGRRAWRPAPLRLACAMRFSRCFTDFAQFS